MSCFLLLQNKYDYLWRIHSTKWRKRWCTLHMECLAFQPLGGHSIGGTDRLFVPTNQGETRYSLVLTFCHISFISTASSRFSGVKRKPALSEMSQIQALAYAQHFKSAVNVNVPYRLQYFNNSLSYSVS